jgi:hypothetical protein
MPYERSDDFKRDAKTIVERASTWDDTVVFKLCQVAAGFANLYEVTE